MVFQFRVTLSGIKGFYRVYQIGGQFTLYDFHKQMRSDMEFPQDQLIMFKAMDAAGRVVARYGLFDLGAGTVDKVTVSRAIEAGITNFLYFYDVPNRKSVIITFEGEQEGRACAPVVVDVKGPNPIEFENGYVAFEDLPDSQRHLPGQKPDWGPSDDDDSDLDDKELAKDYLDDDDDEEEDDDEDGKIVFDGTEDLNI